jgi:dipeptidyl aminopeptidase/acylaminoacyl peptidase
VAIVVADTAGRRADRIESLLSARLFIEPQLADNRITFVSNLSRHLSLYAMDADGGVPEPLLPPQIALQNPDLVGGEPFHVLPALGQILVMIDADGDENYVPHLIPIDGGFPQPLADEAFAAGRSHLVEVDDEALVAFFTVESRDESLETAVRVDLETAATQRLWQSTYGAYVAAWTPDHSRVLLVDGYTTGDVVLYEIDSAGSRTMLFGTPIEERDPDATYPLTGFRSAHGTAGGEGLLLTTTLYEDTGSLAFLDLSRPGELVPVALDGLAHDGVGELEGLDHLEGDRYALTYNIDGCSWAYAGTFDESARSFSVDRVLVGRDELAGGVLHGLHYDAGSGRFVASFCTATSPTQLHVLAAHEAPSTALTRERALGLAPELLSAGEDASYESHDGLRVSARLYLPSPGLGYDGPRPLVYYVHGGPHGQERPNFAWFSMPLIQILTLEGFAVFVPNVRGSSGYGLDYTKRVDRDWGGLDRLDHVHAMAEVLPRDERVDVTRAGVVGRSYGGYMSLTLAARHPELWRAAVDMFGPYDLFTFIDRLPETWKPRFVLAVGDPEHDADFLTERSPRAHIADISCPLLVIQGQNDPRVVERESRDVVDRLRELGREVDYLVFEDEGHDVLKLANRVHCYDTIVRFFSQHLS